MKKLISLSDFVLEQSKIGMEVQSIYYQLQNRSDRFDKIVRFNKFLKQKLELWMFIPCKLVDGVWVVLEEPFNDGQNDNYYSSALQEYQEAKDRVFFERFELGEFISLPKTQSVINKKIDRCIYVFKDECIEDLLSSKKQLTLTQTAQKQIE